MPDPFNCDDCGEDRSVEYRDGGKRLECRRCGANPPTLTQRAEMSTESSFPYGTPVAVSRLLPYCEECIDVVPASQVIHFESGMTSMACDEHAAKAKEMIDAN